MPEGTTELGLLALVTPALGQCAVMSGAPTRAADILLVSFVAAATTIWLSVFRL
jgi:hypothetical protein